jgi:thioredoxin 1
MIVLKDFYADWCGPCKMQSPIIDEIKSDFQDNEEVKIEKINIDENKEEAMKYGVMSIPTLILEKDGEEIKRIVGLSDKESLTELINSNL